MFALNPAFAAVCDACTDEEAFLAALQTAYAKQPGGGLDFAPFAAYWRDGTELPASHRQWLAQAVDLGFRPGAGWFGHSEVEQGKEQCCALLYGDCPPEQWPARLERWLTLFQPLLAAHLLILFACADSKHPLPRGITYETVQQAHLSAAQHLLRRMAEGDPAWAGVAAWLKEHGTDPAQVAGQLIAAPDVLYVEKADAATLIALLVLYRSGVEANSLDWWRQLAFNLLNNVTQVGAPINYDARSTLRKALYRPLQPALFSDLAALGAQLGEWEPARSLWHNFDFMHRCLTEPHWLDWLAGLPVAKRVLGSSSGGSPEEIIRHPAAWLSYLQWLQRHELDLPDQLLVTTPEAVHWYRQTLIKLLPQGDLHRKLDSLITILAEVLPPLELVELLLGHASSKTDAIIDDEVCVRLLTPEVLERLFGGPSVAEWLVKWVVLAWPSRALGQDADPDDPDWPAKPADPQLQHWLKHYSARHPDLFAEYSVEEDLLGRDDPERLAQLWRDVRDPTLRKDLFWKLLCGLGRKPGEALVRLCAEAWVGYETDFLNWMRSDDVYFPYGATHPVSNLVRSGHPELLRLVPTLVAHELGQSSWFGRPGELDPQPVREALSKAPAGWDLLEEKGRIKLLPMLDDPTLVVLGSRLAELFASAKAKGLRDLAANWLRQRSLAAIEQSGLLAVDDKSGFTVVTQGLARHPDSAVLPWLRQRVGRKGLDAFVFGLLLDRLEAAGEDTSAYEAEQSLEALQAEAARAKIPATIKKIWNEDFARLFEPLGEAVGQWTLAQIADSRGDLLSREARKLIERLPPARRVDLAEMATTLWVEQNGAEAVTFLMTLVPRYGDERVVNLLVKAVKAWCKTRKQKASAALGWMAKVPGVYGPAQVHVLWESRKFSSSIEENAWKALEAVAAERGLAIADFLDELVPDFGLGADGLVLDVGPYSYRARLFPDFSLKIENDKGKLTASLPKAKAGEDLDKRGVAEQRLKALSKNLKPLLKQQSKKLERALQSGKIWPVERWQRLFMQHPLLAALARGLSWSALDAQGQPLHRFRPTESATLINLDDEDVNLDGVVSVRLTHPVEVDAAERERWLAHFDDYAVPQTIVQWEGVAELPTAEELQQDELIRHRGHVLNRGAMGSLLGKWGYIKGPGEDGARINYHYWIVDDCYTVHLDHTGISVWFEADEEVAIDAFRIRRHHRQADESRHVRLSELPPSLQATLLAQSQALSERGEGYRSNWQSL
ncbi:DUF4132 domain-containing protein [Chitinimonas lacunae]|uniref:DUF4132 domain-containing protein n=1 Tax=Chitinimonas lacunae TaxID=1963018 RepID=A0ABV8MMH9_9NEIS